MKAKISSIIATDPDGMWAELQKTASLVYVAAPVLIFKSRDEKGLPEKWIPDRQYALKLNAFGIIPLGNHDIVVKRIDANRKEIFTNESSALSKTWNHLIRVERISDNVVKYTDEVEIQAGILTIFVWLFAHFFYRHRQRKWKILLRR